MRARIGVLVRWMLLGAYAAALTVAVLFTYPDLVHIAALALSILAAQLLFLWTLSESPLHQPLPLRRRWLAPLVAAAAATGVLLGVGLALAELADLQSSSLQDLLAWAGVICFFGGTWWLCFWSLGRHSRYRVAVWVSLLLLVIAPVASAGCWAIAEYVDRIRSGWFDGLVATVGAVLCFLVAVWAAGVAILLPFLRARYRRETPDSPERRWGLRIGDVIVLVLLAGNGIAAVALWDTLFPFTGGTEEITLAGLAWVAAAAWLVLVYRFLRGVWRWERAECTT